MKILQVTNAYPTEKLPVYGIFIKEQLESLKRMGLDFDVYFINGREKGKTEYYKAYRHLKKVVSDYDIVHCHHFLTSIVTLAAVRRNKLRRPKVITTFLSDGTKEFITGNYPLFDKLIKQRLYNYILKNSDACIFKKQIPVELNQMDNEGESFANLYYLPNGVNTDVFYPVDKTLAKTELGLDVSKTYVIFASLLDLNRKEKRYDLFKKTIVLLKDKYNRKDLEELALVNVERSKVPLYFNAASLHMITSDFEGSPNSVKESLACNTPVVSTDVGNVRDMIGGLENSFISDSNSPEILAGLAFKSLNNLETEDSRKHIILKGLDMKTKAEELIKIYKEMV